MCWIILKVAVIMVVLPTTRPWLLALEKIDDKICANSPGSLGPLGNFLVALSGAVGLSMSLIEPPTI